MEGTGVAPSVLEDVREQSLSEFRYVEAARDMNWSTRLRLLLVQQTPAEAQRPPRRVVARHPERRRGIQRPLSVATIRRVGVSDQPLRLVS